MTYVVKEDLIQDSKEQIFIIIPQYSLTLLLLYTGKSIIDSSNVIYYNINLIPN